MKKKQNKTREMVKGVVQEITPPVLMRGMTTVKRRLFKKPKGEERDAQYYDELLDRVDHWRVHYTESHYYFLWTVVVDRLLRAGAKRILDIGCGPGQLACLIRDRGIPEYHGFDFSPKRVEKAQEVCPEFRFTAEDAFKTDLFTSYAYDTVLCTEFLEHVERDLDVVEKIAPGTRVVATVPNFGGEQHVRHFKNVDEVRERYGRYFTDFTVDALLANQLGKTYFLMEGTKVQPAS